MNRRDLLKLSLGIGAFLMAPFTRSNAPSFLGKPTSRIRLVTYGCPSQALSGAIATATQRNIELDWYQIPDNGYSTIEMRRVGYSPFLDANIILAEAGAPLTDYWVPRLGDRFSNSGTTTVVGLLMPMPFMGATRESEAQKMLATIGSLPNPPRITTVDASMFPYEDGMTLAQVYDGAYTRLLEKSLAAVSAKWS
jgi:hypothetical protein